jgi:hypothetical protein
MDPDYRSAVDVLTALRHVVGFLAIPVLAGLLAGAATRLLWRRRLAGVRWRRLLAWPVGAAVAAHVAGLVAFGQDGRTATYAGAVVAMAAALGWAAFRGRS